MMKAIDAANFFIALSNSRDKNVDDGVSNMKLQKLLYFAQEACLKQTGHALFDDPIEAWQYGPVVRSVYQQFKQFKRNPITINKSLSDIAKTMSADDVELLTDVYSILSDKTASGLMEMTHQKGTPWSRTFNPSFDKTIPIELIQDYARHDKLWDNISSFMKPTVIPPKKNGMYTLPKEWEDDE